MKRFTLPEWAAIAEIVGTVAVVVSLLSVAYTIKKNTAVLQSANDNFLYDLDDRRVSDLVLNHDLATIVFKYYSGEELSGVDSLRYHNYMVRQISEWEVAFDRHEIGLLSDEKWDSWNGSFSSNIKDGFPEEWWANLRKHYGAKFAEHVDAIYKDN